MDVATITALVAMIISVIAAAAKSIDRFKVKQKEKVDAANKNTIVGAERDSIVVRGAEGALLLMEKTMHAASTECEKRIQELEEENEGLRCELRDMRQEIRESKDEIRTLKEELKDLTTRVRRVE